MSALDQAFIKAYAKDAPAPGESVVHAVEETTPRAETLAAAVTAPSEPLEDLYADAALYRLQSAPEPIDRPSVPSTHFDSAHASPSTNQRRLTGRRRQPREPEIDTVVPPPIPRAPVRRTPVYSLSEIARRLAQYLPPSAAADLPPEVVVVDPAEPELPPAPVASAQQPPEATLGAPAPPAGKAPEPVVAPKPSALPPEPIVAEPIIADEPLVGDEIAPLLEVCTPWEPIEANSAPPAMLVMPTVSDLSGTPHEPVELQLDPFLDRPVQPATITESENAPAAPASTEKTYRLDEPAAAAIPAPHYAAEEESPLAAQPSAEPAAPAQEPPPPLMLAEITEEEAESLLGTPATEPPAPEPAEDSATPSAPPQPLVPMWEVDHFQWPALCNRLLNDDHSYFAQAGEKLVAATQDGLKTLGITGSRRGEGRTTLALCLAKCAAEAGLSVALIDADFTRPQLAAVIGLEVAYGWQDAAQGKIPLAEAAVKSLADKITVLPLEASSVAWPLSLADKRVSETIRAVADSFDLVIVDLGPVSTGSDPIFSPDDPPLDAVIILRDLRYATPAETQAIGERLHASGIEAIGIAENFVPAAKEAVA